PKQDKQCFHCHENILGGSFKAPSAAVLERWQGLVRPYRDAPSLTGSAQRFRRKWLESFLLAPYDLRPHLASNMPRLAIAPEQARDVAAYLAGPDSGAAAPPSADVTRGRKLVEDKGCPACHAYTGVPKLAGTPESIDEKTITAAVALAPDFRTTRD